MTCENVKNKTYFLKFKSLQLYLNIYYLAIVKVLSTLGVKLLYLFTMYFLIIINLIVI